MDVFDLRQRLVDDYARYTRSFLKPADLPTEAEWVLRQRCLADSTSEHARGFDSRTPQPYVAPGQFLCRKPLLYPEGGRRKEEYWFLLSSELDAAFFHLYLGTEDEWRKQPAALTQSFPTPRDAVSYIMDTFPIVKRKDEEKFNGDYRTKRTILEIYDAIVEATKTGKAYETRLAPIPASFRAVHMPRLPKDKRIALASAERFLLSFVYSFLHQTHAEATFDLLDSVFHLVRHRDRHADEFAAAIGDSAKIWLSSFNDKLPNKDFLPFLKRLEEDGWITADRRTGHLSITEKFPALPFDAWRNYDISAALRVIAQQPEVARLVLAQPDTPLASREFQLQKTG